MAILRCTESFVAGQVVFTFGQLVDSADSVVEGREHLFEPVDVYVSRQSARATETATAAPGEVRNVKPRSTRK